LWFTRRLRSGEHGDGRARSELLAACTARTGFACSRDEGHLGSGPGDESPRHRRPARGGAGIRHDGPAKDRKPLTLFTYADDKDDFAQDSAGASESAKCRQNSGGVMCPSYQ